MTGYLAVLEEISARGLSIVAAGPDLRLQGPRERVDADLVGRIKSVKAELLAHLTPDPGFALTPLQRSYLAGRDEVFELGNVASYVYHEIEGHWDIDRLEAALDAVVARHDCLRSRFTPEQTQVRQPRVDVRIDRVDLRDDDGTGPAARRARWTHRMLPAAQAPLLAAEVSLLPGDRMVLHVGHDGLVMDGISMFLFFRDWWAHYEGEQPPADEEPVFESYVAALEAAASRKPYARAKAYWLDRLDNGTLWDHPRLPLAKNPDTITTPRFTQRVVRVPAPRWAALKDHAAAVGVTPSGLLFAAYAETLACWGAGPRFTLTTTVANRPPVHPRILESVGQYSDPMLVSVELDRGIPFAERAKAIQERLRADLDNRHFSGVEVLRELGIRGGGQPRMPFTFNSAIGYPLADVDGSALELFGPEVHTVSQTPQTWLNVFAMEQHGAAVVQLDGVDDLFPPGLLDDVAHGYQRLLDLLTDESEWHHHWFDLLPAEQRERRRAANDTDRPVPRQLLHEPFVAQAQRAPQAPAVITSTGELSYAELYRRARAAAAWLRANGTDRDELVGLVMTRGPEQIVGIMATILAGAAYLPVDADLPARRQQELLDGGEVRCVLTNSGWSDPAGRRAVLPLDSAAATDDTEADGRPEPAPVTGAHPDDLAYVLPTSGTTGTPKGVMVSHRSVANVVADCTRRFGVGPNDRLFAISAFSFDLSVYDVFGALSVGAALVLPDHDKAADPAHWLEMCERGGVTVWNSVPQIVALLHDQACADGLSPLADLRLVMMSGDVIPPELPAALRKSLPGLEVVSLGGPTETTVWNVVHRIGPDDDGSRRIPYGRPNDNNKAYVLDEDGLDLPDWVPGEIFASGTGLARGYWKDERATDEKFRHDPRRGVRLYRTGDLGRYLPSGEIDILGRADLQIKLNGYRVEPGEVETRLVALPGVRQAVVVRRPGSRGDRLVAHLVPDERDRPVPDDERRGQEEELRAALREQLPEYMVPSAVVWHDSLPLTANGKVDRQRLAQDDAPEAEPAPSGDTAPAEGIERELAELWASVLKLPEVDALTPLADIGADSLAAARILAGVRKRYKVTIPLSELVRINTVRAMAARIGRSA
ncbi:non-ribosomal peptide synthetase [Streptomyces ipomoeae]|uniref:non-ribosomal peptide synthetase n=1 Tax=Streptomyces ipomoeae TaxID=103232 RepID=UPI001146F042|nr:non-ribosomal peptide synthetase [Streptomyces ipomoeae]MDX2934499.1 non-ribosomal peptide synthetase [Streptomyces ipomoeae]TQE17381.1 amino acid adenylation domain-containing protein [Streptomyces ipomoeae]